jgi:hypothetical protein
MPNLKYNVVTDDGEPSSVTIFPAGGKSQVATREHPNFPLILQKISDATTEQEVIDLFDVRSAVEGRFNKVSDRVSIRGNFVYFDNMPQEGVLVDTILQFHYAGSDDFMSLVNFMEKIELNPNPNSRENLFRWLKSGRFSITPDGDIIAYKGVNRKTGATMVGEGDANDEYLSTRSGPAIVDGNPHKSGLVPNRPGIIVEMARNEVKFDPYVTCSTGLHVADWSYASGMGDSVLMVLVNPRDVVSVPVDHGDKKMRVCRYKVLKQVDQEDQNMLHVDAALHTLTARMPEWKPAAQLVRAPEKKASKKAATKKAPTKKKAAVKKVAAKPAASKGDGARKTVSGPVKKAAAKPAAKAPAKKAPATVKKAAAQPELPGHYEQFSKAQFASLPMKKLQWLAKQWEVKPENRTADAHVAALAVEAKKRMKKANIGSRWTATNE